MVAWENKTVAIKEDYNQARKYFEDLVRDFETYTQNSTGDTAKAGYKSANQMADVGMAETHSESGSQAFS